MTYDGLDRLASVASPMYDVAGAHFSYDTLDNLTHVNVGGTQGRDRYYCYDNYWRLTNLKTDSCTGASVVGIGYDIQGNLSNKNGTSYTFDFGNRLRQASDAAGLIEAYRYDGWGRRVQATSPAGPILSQYNKDGQLLFQHNSRTGIETGYVYLGGSLVATSERPSAGGTYVAKYQHTDALGSPVAVTDANRHVLETSEYEPYGLLLNRPLTDGPGYTGHVSDAATGLSYMQQRYYDPGIGRFLSVDPVTADGNTGGNFNRYWYANNNPFTLTDPDGRYTCEPAICKAIAGYVKKLNDSRDALTTAGDKRRVNAVLREIGKPGGEGPHYISGELKGKSMAHTDQQGTTTVDVNKAASQTDPEVDGARSLAHEAQHDIDTRGNPANTEDKVRATEQNAYKTEASAAKGLGTYISPKAQADGVEGSVQIWKSNQKELTK